MEKQARKKRIQRKTMLAPDEHLIIAKRQHWLVIVPPIVFLSLFYILFLIGSYVVGFILFHELELFIVMASIFTTLVIVLLTKILVDWYYHIYIITDHKLVELSINPFFSETINDVLLDQVRCTEVDIQTRGFINELFNKGNVVMTFDRPTHEEGFELRDIHNPNEIGFVLSDFLTHQDRPHQFTWYKSQEGDKPYVFIENIFRKGVGVNE